VLGTYFKKTLTIFKISARPTRTFEILTFRNQIDQALNPDQVIKVAQAPESVWQDPLHSATVVLTSSNPWIIRSDQSN
jgi:hypothetical protein